MAKKLLAVLLATMMIVPMVLSSVNAATPADTETYYSAMRFDSDQGYGYSQAINDAHYPTAAYHLTANFIVNWVDTGSDDQHGVISWVNGSPNSAYGFDLFNETIFVAMTGWNGGTDQNTTFLAAEPFALTEGEYYQVDWFVSDTKIEGYVNGDLEITYEQPAGGLFSAGGYIISYPYGCGYDLIDTKVVAQASEAVYVADISEWGVYNTGWAAVNYDEPVVIDIYEIIDWTPYAEAVDSMINAIGTVYYNSDVEETYNGYQFTSTNTSWGALFWMNGYDDVNNPYKIVFDVKLLEPADYTGAYYGGHCGATYLGYSWAEAKWIVGNHSDGENGPGSILSNIAESDTWIPDLSRLYHIEFIFAADHVEITVDGLTMVSTTARTFASNLRPSFFPYLTTTYVANFQVIRLDNGIAINDNDMSKIASNQSNPAITFNAVIRKDSGEAISAARAAYEALPLEAKNLVTALGTLEAAEDDYAAAIAAVAEQEADSIEALIAAIGTVTLDSRQAIVDAELAYANAAPAVQALVENAADLTAARAKYDGYVTDIANVTALIDDIGTVRYQTPTNRETDYDNTGFLGSFTNDNGYSNQIGYEAGLATRGTALATDYQMEFDFQIVSYDATKSDAQLSGGAQNFIIGYDFATKSFSVESGNPWSDLAGNTGEITTQMELLPECVYHWKIQARGNRVTLFIDDVKVAETHALTRVDGNYFIFYPKWCDVKFANYSWYCYVGSYEEAPLEGPLNGQALINSATWGGRGTGYGRDVVTLHADAILDSGAKIAAANQAYGALDAYAKSQIANYSVLEDAIDTYASYASAGAEVANVMALINAIGEVTLESGDAIVAAETAYNALEAGQKALVSNYQVLADARAAYDALVQADNDAKAAAAVEAMIDAIGEVKYNEEIPAFPATEGFRGTFVGDNGYSNQKVNGGTQLIFDYIMEFDFKVIAYDPSVPTSQLAGTAQNFFVGYDFNTSKWVLKEGGSFGDLEAGENEGYYMELCPDCVYHWKLQVETTGIHLWINDELVAESSSIVRVDNNYFILYPKNCTIEFTNYDWWLNLGAWMRWSDVNDAAQPTAPLTGQALIDSVSWGDRGAGYGRSIVNVEAAAHVHDSESAILDAESAYEALTEDQKALVSNYATLVAARESYDAMAEAAADAAAAAAVEALIDAIGEVTAESEDAIIAAETAYEGLTAAQKELVSNYQTLLDARAAYDAIIAEPEIMYGDANGDGAITTRDIVTIRQYLANYDYDTETSTVEVSAGADANGDGSITTRDIVIIRQYLANYDYDTETSTVVLGPQN
jgi:hypothetical protein